MIFDDPNQPVVPTPTDMPVDPNVGGMGGEVNPPIEPTTPVVPTDGGQPGNTGTDAPQS